MTNNKTLSAKSQLFQQIATDLNNSSALLDAMAARKRRPNRPAPEQATGPQTALEQTLSDIFAQVLHLDQVERAENFFDLGGRSLWAVQVLSRITETFQVDVSLQTFFDAPTVAALAAQIEPALNHPTDSTKSVRASYMTPITPRPDPTRHPVSYAQHHLWLREQLTPGKADFNISLAIRLTGSLNLSALEESLTQIIDRHPMLRSAIATIDGEPVQTIGPSSLCVLPVSNLRAEDLKSWLADQAARPFDLAQGGLVRLSLGKISRHDHVLALVAHHLIADYWSFDVLAQELMIRYRAYLNRETPVLPELTIQYADFAHWQQQQATLWQNQLAYWQTQLAGSEGGLSLPTDHARQPNQPFQGMQTKVTLPQSLIAALREISQTENVTLFMLLLTAFKILLFRYTGETDLSIGTFSANRRHQALEAVVGYFVNTLVLRTKIDPELSARDLLNRVRGITLAAYDHQDFPFEKLVGALSTGHPAEQQPLFQTMLILQQHTLPKTDLPGLAATLIESGPPHTPVDLALWLRDDDTTFTATLAYNAALFEAETIRRMLGHFQVILQSLVDDLGRPIATLPLLTKAEQEQLWRICRGADLLLTTEPATPTEPALLHRQFEAQVARTPNASAIQDAETTLTYRTLNQRADRVAQQLQALGAKPGLLVGIMAERSVDRVAGLLGILKVGCAYLPLDPSYPTERLTFMLQDSQAGFLITQRHLADRLPLTQVRVLDLGDIKTPTAHQNGSPLSLTGSYAPQNGATHPNRFQPTGDDQPAYVIYTSGSTGEPKGVVGQHAATLNRLRWMWHAYPFSPDEVCCQLTPLSFVDSVWEVFGPLLQGIPTLIVSEGVRRDPPRLAQMLTTHQITRLVTVPSLLQTILQTLPDPAQALPTIRLWVTSGEELSLDLFNAFQAAMPGCRLLNLYGSSEVSADVTCFDPQEAAVGRRVPIGRPIANTQIYVLDQQQQPVPIGVVGEITVGGAGLAGGYLHHPVLTAERFVEIDLPTQRQRLFKTGDLGRYRADGQLEYLGRRDRQVKLRGYRIELGEVEGALRTHPLVNEVVVIRWGADEADYQLAAYVVPKTGTSLEPDELHQFLKAKLPTYMLPAGYTILTTLSQTPNGKIDRAALPPPTQSRAMAATPFVAPQTELEQMLAQLWQSVLDVETIGVNDSFFDLGGHSLLAVRAVARIQAQFQVSLNLSDLFADPTIAGMARLIEARLIQEIAGLTDDEAQAIVDDEI